MDTISVTMKNKGLAALTTNPQDSKPKFIDNSKNNQISTTFNCDRFNRCSANICPLDPEWHKRKHLNGERICFYLLEAHKTNAKAIFECGGRGCLYALMQEATPTIINQHYAIKYTLQQSKKTGSRLGKKIGGV